MNAKQRLARLASPQPRLSHFDSALALLTLAKPRSVRCSFPSVNGTLFFLGNEGLWKSDGTEEATVLVKEIGVCCEGPRELVNVNGTLLFTAYDGVNGGE